MCSCPPLSPRPPACLRRPPLAGSPPSSSPHRYPYCFRCSWFVIRVRCSLKSQRPASSSFFFCFYVFCFCELVVDLESQVCRVILDWRCDRTARRRCSFALSYNEDSAGFNAGWPMLMALQFGFSVTFFPFFKKKQVLIFERAVKKFWAPNLLTNCC